MPDQTAALTLVDLLQKLGSVGFGTLLALLLLGSFKGIWVWGNDFRKAEASWAERLAKAEAETEKWKAVALQTLGVAETAVAISTSRKIGT